MTLATDVTPYVGAFVLLAGAAIAIITATGRQVRLRRAQRRAKGLRAEYAEWVRFVDPVFKSGESVGGATVMELVSLQRRIASNDELIRQLGGTPDETFRPTPMVPASTEKS